MRMAITGGKTGGHVFPALALVEALRARPCSGTAASRPPTSATSTAVHVETDDLQFLYLGMRGGLEERAAPAAGVPVHLVRLATPGGGWAMVPAAVFMLTAALDSFRTLRRFRPDVLYSTGGFVSVPATLAAAAQRVPIVIFVPDAVPGRAVRATARLASAIATSTPAAAARLPAAKAVVTGYPVRAAFERVDAAQGRAHFGLDPLSPVLLVTGASQGSRSINRAVVAALPELLSKSSVLHVTGPAHYEAIQRERDGLPADVRGRYHVFPFLSADEMALAMRTADLAISRAGASVIGELPAAALPAILVPLPQTGVNQTANASVLADAGAAVVVPDAELPNGRLIEAALDLLAHPARLHAMKAAMAALHRPDAAAAIADLVCRIAWAPHAA